MALMIAGERVENVIKAREGTVFITAKHVYKVLGKGTNPYDALQVYKTAELKGVPVPDTAKFTALLQDGSNSEFVGGLCSTRAFGRFFQISKGGGLKTLINEILLVQSRERLLKILAGLENAGAAGLTDPQGFINVNADPPLCFIDVHLRNLPTDAFHEAIEAARMRLDQLG